MRFGSVCSGIEAASVAWEPLGWEPAWFAEVDAAASAVLAYRFPYVTNLGDMTALPEMVRYRLIEAPDILVGGTPCQSFSIAGRRLGLDDTRGQLTLAYVELVDAIDDVRRENGDEECIAVWENVPGCLSSHDNAFGCFLAALAGDDDPLEPGPRPEPGKSTRFWSWDKKSGEHRPKWPVSGYVDGPSRAVAWRVQDAQYHGLAQRRLRVFVVASAREGFDPSDVLPEFDGVRRDSPPSREAGEGFTHATAPCLTSSGRGVERTGEPRGQDPVVDGDNRVRESDRVVSGLDASYARLQGCSNQDANHGHSTLVLEAFGGNNCSGPIAAAAALNAHGGPHGRLDFETETFVVHGTQDPIVNMEIAHPLARITGQENAIAYAIQERAISENPDAGPDGVGVRDDDRAYTLEARTVPQAVAYSVMPMNSGKDFKARETDVAQPLMAGGPVSGNQGGDYVVEPIPFDTTQVTSPSNYSNPKAGDPCHPLAAGAHPPAVCVTEPVTHTLRAEGFDASEDGTGRGQPITATSHMAVRRLMPIECERLQGFPDNWTRIPVKYYPQIKITKNRPAELWERDPEGSGGWLMAADGPRYKQLGNSMATRCMNWIGRRIVRHLDLLPYLRLIG